MNEYVAKRLQILGRVQEILFNGIMTGKISNLVVYEKEKFAEVWKDKLEMLYERIQTIEEALDEAYDLIREKEEDEE